MSARSVEEYLESLPEERRATVAAVRDTVRASLGEGYEEGIQYGMIGWYVPHSRYPAGYHCDPKQPVPFVGLGAKQRHIALYLFCIYVDPAARERFTAAWQASGHKLDMGKGCVRFKRIDQVPLQVVADAISAIPLEAFLANYEAGIPPSARKRRERAPRS